MSSFNAGRGRGGSQQNIRRRGAFFSSQGSVTGLGAPQTSTTAASAASTAGESAFDPSSSSSSGFAGPSPRPLSSSGPTGPTSHLGSSGQIALPPRPSLFSGPTRRPSVAPLGYIEFDDSPTPSTFTSACVGPPQSSLSAPRAISYGTGSHSAPPLSGLVDFNATPRPTPSAGLGHPNLPSSAPVSPSPLAIRVPTDALSRFMELKQFMNRLQKAVQDCHTVGTNPFAPHLNIMEINYGEEFKIELAAFEEACRLLDQLIARERNVMRPLMHTVLPMTMRRAVAVRKEVYRLQTSPDMTLNTAVDSLMALFGGLDQMFAGRDFMTEEWVALKDKWLAQGTLFI